MQNKEDWLWDKGLATFTKRCESLISDCTSGVVNVKHIYKFQKHWLKYFRRVCKYLGFKDDSDILYLYDNFGSDLNWKKLHLSDEEREISPGEWISDMQAEVFYCSDRWSLIRLLRTHWIYVQIFNSYSRTFDEVVLNYHTDQYLK